jgi:hypothetical protein
MAVWIHYSYYSTGDCIGVTFTSLLQLIKCSGAIAVKSSISGRCFMRRLSRLWIYKGAQASSLRGSRIPLSRRK